MTRLVLAPGLRVLDLGPRQLQIGITPGTALRLPAGDDVRRALHLLERGEALTPSLRRARDTLAGVLVDADALRPEGIEPGDAAAAAISDPAGFADRLAARRRTSVAVLGALGPDPRPLLSAAGVGIADDPARATAALVLVAGEPDRALLDPFVRADLPHLLVRAVEGSVVVGPLVVPGRTACLRCLDTHHAADDPLYPALVGVHHRAQRPDDVADPLDSALATLAVAWAVRDLVTHLDGERPATWSATLHAPPLLAELTLVQWLRHPDCGCVWT